MLSEIGTHRRDVLTPHRIAFSLQLAQHTANIDHVLEDHCVGHQIILLDDLLLFLQIVLGNDALAAEEQLAGRSIVGLDLVGHLRDSFPHLRVR